MGSVRPRSRTTKGNTPMTPHERAKLALAGQFLLLNALLWEEEHNGLLPDDLYTWVHQAWHLLSIRFRWCMDHPFRSNFPCCATPVPCSMPRWKSRTVPACGNCAPPAKRRRMRKRTSKRGERSKVQLTEQHVIKRSDPRFAVIDAAAFASKNLYNAALYELRQAYIHEGHYITYNQMDKLMQPHEAYKALPAKVAQQVLRQLDKNWQSFFAARDAYDEDPSKFTGRPRLPNYKHKTEGRKSPRLYRSGDQYKRFEAWPCSTLDAP